MEVNMASQNINQVPNGTHAEFRGNLNKALESLACGYYGPIDPSTIAGMKVNPFFPWGDSASNIWKIRNLTNDGWISFMDLTTGNVLTKAQTADDAIKLGGKNWVEIASGNANVLSTPQTFISLLVGGQFNQYQFSVYCGDEINSVYPYGAGSPNAYIRYGPNTTYHDQLVLTGNSPTVPIQIYYKVWAWK
jgi:hypothetical protein